MPRIRINYENIKFTEGSIIKESGTSNLKYNIDLNGYKIKKWWFSGKYILCFLSKRNSPHYVVRTHSLMYGKIIVSDKDNIKPRSFMTWLLDNELYVCWYSSQITILDPSCETDQITSNIKTCSSKEMIKR